uniref:Uncharacterized protein n=1 Tax=Anguilla anguilla TaxID=7936 RepID=A0A0E9QXC4_ANGAN
MLLLLSLNDTQSFSLHWLFRL